MTMPSSSRASLTDHGLTVQQLAKDAMAASYAWSKNMSNPFDLPLIRHLAKRLGVFSSLTGDSRSAVIVGAFVTNAKAGTERGIRPPIRPEKRASLVPARTCERDDPEENGGSWQT